MNPTRNFIATALLVCAVFCPTLAAADAAKTRELLAVVQSAAPLEQRARACQQLAIVGTTEAVPAMAALLADENLGHYARDVLEVMPEPAAVDALRAALDRLQGNALIGVINSLGVRRDREAVAGLARIARNDSGAADAALRALGRIASPEAARVLGEMLSSAAANRRAVAAEAMLVAIERLDPNAANASPLYDVVRKADVPITLRAVATRGAILGRGETGWPLLLEQLRSSEEPFREVALRCLREMRPEALRPSEVIAELTRLPAPLQALVIGAIADRSDADQYLAAIESRASGGATEVRAAALRALGRIGRGSSVPVLLDVAASPDPADSAVALASLGRLNASEADAAILRAIAKAPAPTQIRLIAVLGERNAAEATPELLRLAGEGAPEVRPAALRALAIVAKPAELPALIRLASAPDDEAARTLADRAIVTTAMKILEPPRRAAAVLDAFRHSSDPATKAALLRPLGAIVRAMGGSHEVFFAVRAALKDPSAVVRTAALKCLTDWPDAAPATVLLELASQPGVPEAEREIAWRGAVRMAGEVASGRERSPLDVTRVLTRANRLVRSKDDKLVIVSALGNLRRPESVALLQPYLEDRDVREEAGLALVQIAPSLVNTKIGPTLRPSLERIAASSVDDQLRQKARRLAKGGPPENAKGKGKAKAKAVAPAPDGSPLLFNGTDLAGWDGDPGVWRVRDGMIVGGSLEGNPRNEFLAMARPQRNFVLRLEYQLVGTEGFVNGGVQFRSVRVNEPPNEMSGYQADIGAGHSGCLYDETRRRKFLARATDEQIKRLEKPGDWNRYEIRCDGARIELTLNGERTVSFTEQDPAVARDGLIALQIHGNCKAEIRFRHLELQALP